MTSLSLAPLLTILLLSASAQAAPDPSSMVTCDPMMEVFPVVGPHNIGYDASSCGTGTCEVSCPDENANSDWGGDHHGIDVFAHQRAEMVAVADAVVQAVGVVSDTSGLRVRLRDSCGWEYYYGHLDEAVVVEDQVVQAGELIGYMGRTGTPATHLHFNVSPDGHYSNDIDPFDLLNATSPTACASTECGDGTCDFDEDTASCPSDCPPCATVDASGPTIIDDRSTCFVVGGDPTTMRQEAEGWTDTVTWTYASDQTEASNYGQWDIHLLQSGSYLVEAYTPQPWAQSRSARYQVATGTGVETVTVDQTAIDGWTPIGEFDLQASQPLSVRLDDNTGEPYADRVTIAFDAIRLTPIRTDDEGNDQPGDHAGGGSGGCSVAAPGGWAGTCLLLFLGLFAVIRRPRHAR